MDEEARVFLLWHQHDPDDDDTAKMLGVCSSRERAAARTESSRLLPGFRHFPEAFLIAECIVDKDEWTSGFATMDTDGKWVEDPDPE